MTRKGGEDRGLYQRPKGSGIWWIRYADEYGKEHREKVGPKGLARKVYTKRKAAVIERRFNPESIRRREMTLQEAIDDTLVRAKSKRKSYRDMKRYAERWGWLIGSRPIRTLTHGDIERIEARRREDGASDYLIYQELSFLRRVFSLAERDGVIDRNPLRGVAAVKARRVRYLTDAEEAELLEALDPKWRPHVQFAIHTGMRAGEQFSLKRSQLDYTALVVGLNKTKSGYDRTVPLNARALDALRQLPKHIKSEFVFYGERLGHALDHHNFTKRVFRPAVKEAGLANLRWNDLRHTFASRLAMAGVDLYTIADLLGHTSLSQVRKYAHLSPQHRGRAVSALEQPAPVAAPAKGRRHAKGGGK